MRRSLRRIEHEERGLVTRTRYPVGYPLPGLLNAIPVGPSLWGSGWGDHGDWILVPEFPCSNCRWGPFYHRFLTKDDCEKALADWNKALNRPRAGLGFYLEYGIGVLGRCDNGIGAEFAIAISTCGWSCP